MHTDNSDIASAKRHQRGGLQDQSQGPDDDTPLGGMVVNDGVRGRGEDHFLDQERPTRDSAVIVISDDDD